MVDTPPPNDHGPVDTTPIPETPPVVPPPSPTVQPFMSGGGPPPPEVVKRKGTLAGPLALLLPVILLLVAAAAAYYFYGDQIRSMLGLQPQAAVLHSTKTYADGLSMKSVDDSLNEVNTNLSDSGAALNDKAGDLSE